MQLFLDLQVQQPDLQVVQALIFDDGQHVSRGVHIFRQPVPLLPERHETVRHQILRNSPVAHVTVGDLGKPGIVVGIQSPELRGGNAGFGRFLVHRG